MMQKRETKNTTGCDVSGPKKKEGWFGVGGCAALRRMHEVSSIDLRGGERTPGTERKGGTGTQAGQGSSSNKRPMLWI